jgi:mono/diheme cytochrome c family protein
MKLSRVFAFVFVAIFFAAAGLLAVDTNSPGSIATTPAVYVPDMSHAHEPLPDGVLVWDATSKSTDVAANEDSAHFTFNFTNVTGGNVVFLDVHPSCGCTTTELPPLPWTIPPGTNGQIGATVNVQGKNGMLFKTVTVSTDKGSKMLSLRINILPPVIRTMTDAQRAQGVAIAKVDRQMVFRGDCASCHVKSGAGKYSQALYEAVCGICHEAEHRATMVPDLHALKTPTNDEFWRTWIAHGKAGSLMPAFSTAEGGPLSDMQIASIAAYLDVTIPSHVAPPPQ